MRSTLIGFAAGAAVLQHQASLPLTQWLVLALAAAIVVLAFADRRMHTAWRCVLMAVSGMVMGFAWAGILAQHYLDDELSKDWEGRDVAVVGTIDSLPYAFAQGVRFNLAVERVVQPDAAAAAVPKRLALSWYSAQVRDDLAQATAPKPGERWQLNVRLRRPHGNANPHGFDYEAWLLEQGIRATGYVRADAKSSLKNQRLDGFVPGVGNAIERCRGWLRSRIETALVGKEYAGVVVALVIGDQRAVSQDDWQVFNRTGIGHLISISGLHITMISGLVAALFSALWRRSFFIGTRLPLLLPAQKAAALAGLGAALLYVMLAGFGVPAQRTLYMLAVVALALWSGRITDVSHVLCMALGVVVLLDPWAVLWPGFWLSFSAVAILLFAGSGRTVSASEASASIQRSLPTKLKTASHLQYVVTIGLVPFTLLLFGQISLVSPVANALAIPLVSFVITPLSLLGAIVPALPGDWMLIAAHAFISWLAGFLTWLSAFSFAVWSTPAPPWWAFAIALAGTLWLLAPRGWPLRWMGAICLLPVLLAVPTRPRDGQVWLTAFDVGQGTAVLVETSRHRMLYDTGPAYSAESDSGNRVILPYLAGRGIRSLDMMMVSHSDTDHSGGAMSILDEIDVADVSSSLPLEHPIVLRSRHHRRCEEGHSWTWDGIRFELLHPGAASYAFSKLKPNARSCTLRISTGGRAALLPGDIEAAQELALVRHDPERLRASILLAPHHGSGTSSTPQFLAAVNPELALFQVGYRNRYRHPKAEIYDRYGELGIRRLRSDESGAVTIVMDERIQVREYRRERARYWQDTPAAAPADIKAGAMSGTVKGKAEAEPD
ncbi:DNA internalization-related competence protein ComEC/Rec2 [Noviherbaspirillum aerium]|uniref:DNA internalization-related competence protein ComEC/Rec2 n=1 Tax=Noviherbaspirillum aerium TaxID=2588497 RepID=UPI00124E4041|nr:DNA internalization-related competence protein ComEC/Rec2 [Noviherbaspirillum aerium]